jgi:hypothetical protein
MFNSYATVISFGILYNNFGIFCGHLVHFFPVWYVVPRRIWQPSDRYYDFKNIFAEKMAFFAQNYC